VYALARDKAFRRKPLAIAADTGLPKSNGAKEADSPRAAQALP
jgi:hypothetical protein